MTPTNTIPLKAWLHDQGAKVGISGHGYYQRIRRGDVPKPSLIRHNKRRIDVILNPSTPT